MKLASLKIDRPDGHLVVVGADLAGYVSAGRIAPTLQFALENWPSVYPALADLAARLAEGSLAPQPFEPGKAMAPLPRAFQWIDGTGYMSHLERAGNLRGAEALGLHPDQPLLYRGASDWFAGPRDPIVVPNDDMAPDFEAEIAVILGPVPAAPSREEALAAIRLVTICNDLSLRRLVSEELESGFGFFHAKPLTAFAPVAVTPETLGSAWRDGKLHLPVRIALNERLFGQPDAGTDMDFDFPRLIMAAAQSRPLGAGTIIGSGTISNRTSAREAAQTPPIAEDGVGFACIAEARTVEKLKYGRARTPFLKLGDRITIAALEPNGRAVFGAIEQQVTRARGP